MPTAATFVGLKWASIHRELGSDILPSARGAVDSYGIVSNLCRERQARQALDAGRIRPRHEFDVALAAPHVDVESHGAPTKGTYMPRLSPSMTHGASLAINRMWQSMYPPHCDCVVFTGGPGGASRGRTGLLDRATLVLRCGDRIAQILEACFLDACGRDLHASIIAPRPGCGGVALRTGEAEPGARRDGPAPTGLRVESPRAWREPEVRRSHSIHSARPTFWHCGEHPVGVPTRQNLILRLAAVMRLPRGYVRLRSFQFVMNAVGEVCRAYSEQTGESYGALVFATMDLAAAVNAERARNSLDLKRR